MRKQLKDYRRLANIFESQFQSYLQIDSESDKWQKESDLLIFSLWTKLTLSENTWKNYAVRKEITKLIGEYRLNQLLYRLFLSLRTKDNPYIEMHKKAFNIV